MSNVRFWNNMKVKAVLLIALLIVITVLVIKVFVVDHPSGFWGAALELPSDHQVKVNQLLNLSDSLKEVDIERAFEYVCEADEIVEDEDLSLLRPKVFETKGILYQNKSDYLKALNMFMKATTLYENLLRKAPHDSSLKLVYGDCLNHIAKVYFDLDRKDKALEYLQSSLKIYKELDNKSRIASGMRNLGGIYFSNKMYNRALELYHQVLQYYNELGVQEGLDILYSNMGAAYLVIGKPEKSIQYLDKAEHEYLKAREKDTSNSRLIKGLSQVYYNKACYFSRMNNDMDYEKYLLKSLKVLNNIYAPEESGSPTLNLHILYSKKGDFKQAYHYLLLYQNIHDSLFNIEKVTKISELEKHYEFARAQQNYELQNRKSELKYWMILSGMLFLLIIIIIFFNRLRNKARKVELEKDKLSIKGTILESQININEAVLSTKENKLKKLASQIVEKNNSISSLQESVNKVNAYFIKEVKHEKITDILKNTGKSVNIDNDRQEFLLGIEQISINMFARLDHDFPGLTKREKYLAALVKHEFTAKEISILFDISHKGAQIGKYRLKKHLNLSADQDLEEFLKNY